MIQPTEDLIDSFLKEARSKVTNDPTGQVSALLAIALLLRQHVNVAEAIHERLEAIRQELVS